MPTSGFRELADGLRRAFPIVRDEAVALPKTAFVPWPMFAAYCGEWLVFPLFLQSWPEALESDFGANQTRCPGTMSILRGLGMRAAAFSRLGPGTHILPHRDAPDPGVIRYHLALVAPRGGYLRVGDEWLEWVEGDVHAFDGQIEHEALHTGRSERLILMADYAHS